MILFKGVVHDLKYKEDREALSTKVYYDMKFNDNIYDYVNSFNHLNNVIMRGDETALVKEELYKSEYDLEFKYVQQESLLENVLSNLGYDYKKAWGTRSIYAYNDNGERIRISNHSAPYNKRKRNHNMNKLITKERSLTFGKGIVGGLELINNGFNKVNPEQEYYLY